MNKLRSYYFQYEYCCQAKNNYLFLSEHTNESPLQPGQQGLFQTTGKLKTKIQHKKTRVKKRKKRKETYTFFL